jgi:hypothetical protein
MSWQQPWLALFLEMILAMLFGCSRKGSALVRGPNKGHASDNHAMSAMYEAIRAYQGLECTYWMLTGLCGDDRLKARKQKKKQAHAIASLQEQLANMSLQ